MKFSISSADLLKQLQKVYGAIGSNPVIPILEDFLFSIQESELTITATDLETTVLTKTEVLSDKNGITAIPAKILLDTLKALPEQPISFEVNEETNGIEITSAFGKYKLAGDNPEDYPEIPQADNTAKVELDGELLQKSLNKTIFATSSDELRLAMTGVFVQVDFNNITFVSTDAHKLVKYTFFNISSEDSESFILPKKSLTLLKNAVPQEGKVEVSYNKLNAFFSFDDTLLICRLIDAKYPDYNAVIPVQNPNIMTASRSEFLHSLKRIAIYANKTTNQVILTISDGSLTISAQDLDFSNEATEQLSCVYEGEPMAIGFNAKFLQEMLSVLETDEVKLELSTPNRAGILLPGELKEEEDLLMLVMPVMVSH